MSHVKVGQVWQDKNSGGRHEVIDVTTVRGMPWCVLRHESNRTVREAYAHHVTDDYVLVKDAEEAGATATKTGGVLMVTVHGNAPLEVAAKHVAEAINNAAAGWSATSESNTVTVTQRHDFTGVVEEVK